MSKSIITPDYLGGIGSSAIFVGLWTLIAPISEPLLLMAGGIICLTAAVWDITSTDN